MHMQSAYKELCCPECCPESVKAAKSVMSLPMHPDLNETNQVTILNSLYSGG